MSADEYEAREGGRIPPEGTVKAAFARAHPFSASTSVEERYAEFDRFLARVRREAADEAWTDCVSEASALGWLHPSAALDMLDRNPHKETP